MRGCRLSVPRMTIDTDTGNMLADCAISDTCTILYASNLADAVSPMVYRKIINEMDRSDIE